MQVTTQENDAVALSSVAPDLRLPALLGDVSSADLFTRADEDALWQATLARLSAPGDATTGLLVDMVLGCTSWDALLRERRVFPSAVYFASSAAVAQVAHIAGTERADEDTVEELLSGLFAVELVYRFPVALKFRGVFGPERQVRLNCWGRRLGARLRVEPAFAAHAADVDERLRAHFDDFEYAYRRHMEHIAHADDLPPGAAWSSAAALPIGLLW